jgi:hypothetical protein
MKELTRNLVSSVLKNDKRASSVAFEAVIKEKINAALDARKIEIANSVFNQK